MRPHLLAPFAASAVLALTAGHAAAQTPAAKAPAAKPAAPAAQAQALAPGQVAVKLQCRGMPDGTLKECKALDSQPKNPEAEQAAVQLAAQQKGKPPAGWPAEGKIMVLPLVLSPAKSGG